ncbi:hypothetical protein CcaverHIS002_0608820 [Cutaneotrichosporon cavernicola]|uniref:Uncharacterized protein n=1 Tax=Cutaneotrichosporon cavernicola TaxID=279322 RepID=A0AA48L998_9TREE|nr:uncharacterized protein CcaverHIS019_0608280 [Cutaneotrichosporon cavernicola]BEI86595.1 hypothetical protein CcaverHIS002_0608820 [Cutaneotrichosporon cavernicola]BEI94369.1 hypothetical protein CcaverHIS019_0608280 [Cutaneotrichosporon cavernicola]BEJ02146.1 hypothetical protein CcaverHIS631_0608280 [Cutaneotrichosporon cavernicola]BEJ09907.1 hypothetical protein CcaverHIS641_0608220 [Cutaneotrichosporon cavernicola]
MAEQNSVPTTTTCADEPKEPNVQPAPQDAENAGRTDGETIPTATDVSDATAIKAVPGNSHGINPNNWLPFKALDQITADLLDRFSKSKDFKKSSAEETGNSGVMDLDSATSDTSFKSHQIDDPVERLMVLGQIASIQLLMHANTMAHRVANPGAEPPYEAPELVTVFLSAAKEALGICDEE